MPDGLSKLGKDWEYDECGRERGCGCGNMMNVGMNVAVGVG